MNVSDTAQVTIDHEGGVPVKVSPEDMAALAGGVFPLSTRVPGAEGEAFDWSAWYDRWRASQSLQHACDPCHLKVEAADGFQAVIPWNQLKDAAVLIRVDGVPLVKAAPVRLYVPNGTSACLNVKSVVAFRIACDPNDVEEASYGFKNTFAPEELRKP